METQNDNINVNWVEMNPEKHRIGEEKKLYPSPIPGHYDSLYDELLDKCNPGKYATQFSYNYELLKIANNLYSEIVETGNNNHEKLVELRKEAVKELGIKISTEDLYNYLLKQTDPQRFMYPYNKELVALANEFHQQTLLKADNIEALEIIQFSIKDYPFFEMNSNEKSSYDDVDSPLYSAIIIAIAFSILVAVILFAIATE